MALRILILFGLAAFGSASRSFSIPRSYNGSGVSSLNLELSDGKACQEYIINDVCNWTRAKATININLTNPCTFNCTYNPSVEHEGPLKLSVILRSSWLKEDVFVSVQQNHDIHAYHLPIFFPDLGKDQPYITLEKIFCPPKKDKNETLYVRITSSKDVTVNIDLKPTPTVIKLNQYITTNPTPVSATVLHYVWQEDQESVLVTATDRKNGDVCALFSLQNAQCPYNTDEESIVAGGGKHQSILVQGGLIGRRSSFPDGIHIVILPLPSNDLCFQLSPDNINRTAHTKSVTITVQPHYTISESWGTFVGMGIFVAAVVGCITILSRTFISRHFNRLEEDEGQDSLLDIGPSGHLNISVIMGIVNEEEMLATSEDERMEEEILAEPTPPQLRGTARVPIQPPPLNDNQALMQTSQENNVQEALHQDVLRFTPSYNPRYVFWWKSIALYNTPKSEADLTAAGFQKNLVLMGVFMALPFAELLRSYFNVFSYVGAEDQCHFNSRCITALWIFNDFARVFTNIGYLLCGGGFILIVRLHKYHSDSLSRKLQGRCVVGVSHNYELFKGLAYTMIIQCVMSSMYHICPNEVTLRFDMLFIYIIAVLVIVGIWGLRHGNVSEHVYSSLGLVGTVLILAELQEWFPAWLFWVLFAILQCLLTTTTTYCLVKYGTWSFSPYSLIKILKKWNPILKKMQSVLHPTDSGPPFGTTVKVMFGVGTNIALVLLGGLFNMEIYKYILLVCLVHMGLYLINYLFSKMYYRERCSHLSSIMLAFSFLLWVPSVVFFFLTNTDSELTPALSRLLNSDCILMSVFSYHDLWHLSSAFALFLTFIGILTMDDHLSHLPSERIPVF